jgi:hypothetical protein
LLTQQAQGTIGVSPPGYILYAPGNDQHAYNVAAGCLILAQLPLSAQSEAIESLRDIWEFYSANANHWMVPENDTPELVSGGRALPAASRGPLFFDEG